MTSRTSSKSRSRKHYVELVIYRTLAGLRAEASGSYLNFLWWFIEPIVYMFVFYLIFGVLLKRSEDPNFVIFLLCGLTAWKWFSGAVDFGSQSILRNAALMGQVHLPKIIFPCVGILHTTIKFLIVFFILLVAVQFFKPGFTEYYLALPIVLLTQLLFICAIVVFLASIVPLIPDLTFVVRNLLQLMFFTSGIFYAMSDIPEPLRSWLQLNPMVGIIGSYRSILIHSIWPVWEVLIKIGLGSLIVLFLSYKLITRLDRVYPKIV